MGSAPRQRQEWRNGWRVVAAAMIGGGTGPGLYQNLSSLFTPGMAEDFGWSRGDIATAAGLGLIGGLVVPLMGRFVDRTGVKPMIVAAMLTLGVAHTAMAFMTGGLWQYQLLVLALAMTVAGTSSLVYGKLIGAAFVVHRGLALGVATSGLSITTFALPPLIAIVIAAYGWRGGYVALGILAAVVALPLVLLALRGRAERLDPAWAPLPEALAGVTAAEARRDYRLWSLGIAAMLINIATVGLVTQLVPFGLDRGLGAGEAALLLAAYGASQMAGRLTIGALVDRFRPQAVAAVTALISAIAFMTLQVEAPGFALAMAAVFFAGLMHGAESDLLPFFGVRMFGLRAFGEVYGMLLMIALVGTAVGIVGFGRLHDLTGGYAIALWIAVGAMVGAAVLFATLKDRAMPVPARVAEPA